MTRKYSQLRRPFYLGGNQALTSKSEQFKSIRIFFLAARGGLVILTDLSQPERGESARVRKEFGLWQNFQFFYEAAEPRRLNDNIVYRIRHDKD